MKTRQEFFDFLYEKCKAVPPRYENSILTNIFHYYYREYYSTKAGLTKIKADLRDDLKDTARLIRKQKLVNDEWAQSYEDLKTIMSFWEQK